MDFVQAASAMFRRLKPFILLFLIAQFFIRLTLTLVSAKDLSLAPRDWLVPFLTGFWFDLVTLLPIVAAMLLFPLLLPVSLAGKRFDRAVGLSAFAVALFLMAVQGLIGPTLRFWPSCGTGEERYGLPLDCRSITTFSAVNLKPLRSGIRSAEIGYRGRLGSMPVILNLS